MNIGYLLQQIPSTMKNLYREYEKTRKKIMNAKWSIVFNKTCINIYIYIGFFLIF